MKKTNFDYRDDSRVPDYLFFDLETLTLFIT
jgi:hypothetical protein